ICSTQAYPSVSVFSIWRRPGAPFEPSVRMSASTAARSAAFAAMQTIMRASRPVLHGPGVLSVGRARPIRRDRSLRADERDEVGLGQQGYPLSLRLGQLRGARFFADDEPGGLLRHGAGHLRATRLERGSRFLAAHRLEGAGEHVRPPGQGTLGGPLFLAELEPKPELPELRDERPVLLVPEPLDDQLRPVG